MPKLIVEESMVIAATPEHVFGIVSNLRDWRPWNPWLVTEPEAVVDVTEGGKAYAWKGTRTGEGSMRITAETAPSQVDYELLFLTPWKSQSRVSFRIAPEGEGSRVTWTMNGSLPFFLFFLRKMMIGMLRMDYQRGLVMLDDFATTGAVPSRLVFAGERDEPGRDYVGITTECAIDDIGAAMGTDFERLDAWRDRSGIEVQGDGFSIYHDWNLTKGRCRYTSGYPVSTPGEAPPGFVAGTIPPLRAYVVEHIGSYKHLGNGWSAGMMMARSKEFRQSRAQPPFETYANRPGEVPDEELRVAIHFPLK